MINRLVALFFFISLSHFSVAQDQDCTVALDLAKEEFAAGHLESISSILGNCIDEFSDLEKIEAYRLLTITYLYLDDPYAAKKSFLDLLGEEPEFRVSESDPIELEYLSRKYITTPIVSYSFKAGANFSAISVINRYTVGNINENNWKYISGAGFNILAGLNLHFSKNVGMDFELEFGSRSFTLRDTLFSSEPNALEQQRTNYHASVPVSIKFKYPRTLYHPYVYLGYSPSFTISSKATNKRDPETEAVIEGPLDLINITPLFSHSIIMGGGLQRRLKYKQRYIYVFVDLRYRLGMSNMLNTSNQYDFSDPDLKEQQFSYLISEDDYRWSGFEFAIGFRWPKYKPRLKNSVTIQTVIKGIFSKNKDESK